MVHTALLRVTEPCGLQRSTYYLQLPYLYAIPLLIVSTLLHRLVSQSIFIAHIAVYERRGRLEFGHVQVRLLLHLDLFFLAILMIIAIAGAALIKFPGTSSLPRR